MNVENVIRQEQFSFAKNTTYRCGGNAKVAYFPRTVDEAVSVYKYLSEENIQFVTLGNGSNVLASDKYFDGAVISTKLLSGIRITPHGTLSCLAGTKVSTLLSYCVNNGLGGIEYLAGIPATVGGLVFMNGGAGGVYINNNVSSVEIFDGQLRELNNKNCHFGYKYSTMRDVNCIILSAELKITPSDGKDVLHKIETYKEKRKGQPKGASCGCVFKNADGVSAGKLIDEAGLKGLAIGGAQVSREHANFIINTGTKSSDVYSLINEVRRRVFERTGILLENEVIYIGEL